MKALTKECNNFKNIFYYNFSSVRLLRVFRDKRKILLLPSDRKTSNIFNLNFIQNIKRSITKGIKI